MGVSWSWRMHNLLSDNLFCKHSNLYGSLVRKEISPLIQTFPDTGQNAVPIGGDGMIPKSPRPRRSDLAVNDVCYEMCDLQQGIQNPILSSLMEALSVLFYV